MRAFIGIVVVLVLAGALFFKLGWNEKVGDMASDALADLTPQVEKVEKSEAGDTAAVGTDAAPGSDPEAAPPLPSFPFERTLIDSQGRELPATVMAKKGSDLAIRRTSDGKEYTLSLNLLSQADKDFFSRLPDDGASVIEDIAHEKKIAGRHARWHEDFVNAQREATKLDLPIYFFFSGTLWSEPSQRMDKEIINSREFRDFADSNLVLMRVDIAKDFSDTPHEKNMLSQFKVSKFPTVIVMNAQGEKIDRHSGKYTSTTGYLEQLKKAVAKAK